MKVLIPTSLRKHTDGQATISVEANDVGEALQIVVKHHPGLQSQLFDADGNLVSYINVFVNDENIRDLQDQATLLDNQDELLLVPALAGG